MTPAGKRLLLGVVMALVFVALAYFFAFGYFAGRTSELPREPFPGDGTRPGATPPPTNPGEPGGTVGLK